MHALGYSISTALLAACSHGSEQFNLLSRHDNACNFIGDNGTLLAFVTARYGNGPFHLVVPPAALAQIQVQPQARLQDMVITAGALRLPLRALPAWDAQLPPLLAPTLTTFALLNKHYRTVGQPALGFCEPAQAEVAAVTATHHPATVQYQLRAQKAITLLFSGLHEDNTISITQGTQWLAGLGPGLTPAGDDFLVGLLAALYAFSGQNMNARGKKLQIYANTIVDVASPRTTTLSAAWLTYAGRGAFGAAWHHLIEALNGNSLPAISASADRILATGATSGADALGGFLFGVRVLYQ